MNHIRRFVTRSSVTARRMAPIDKSVIAPTNLVSPFPVICPLRIPALAHTWVPVAHVSTKTVARRIRIPKPKIKIPLDEYPGNDQFHYEVSDPGSNKRIEFTKNLFQLPDEIKAQTLLHMYPKLRYEEEEHMLEIRDFLIQNGVSVRRFLAQPLMFTLSTKILNDKVETIKHLLQIDTFPCAIEFVEFSTQRLLQLGHLWKSELPLVNSDSDQPMFKNRIEYIAHHLRCEDFEVAEMLLKVPGTLSRPFLRVKKKLAILLENGIQPADIVRDPYIFLHTTKRIEARLELTKLDGLHTVKPWLLRCVQATYDSYVDRINQEQALLSGHKDIQSFLSKRLGCSSAFIADILYRVPSIRKASASKLNDMIEFLYAQGFGTDYILETPRILGHSVETVNKRMTELAACGFKVNSLFPLCQTTKSYNSLVRKVRKDATGLDDSSKL